MLQDGKVVVKGLRVKDAFGMPEGAELVLGSLDLEVDAAMPADHFRWDG